MKSFFTNKSVITLLIIIGLIVINLVLFSQEKSFTQKDEKTDSTKQCLDCHNKIIKVKGREIPNISLKYKMKTIHDPYDLGCIGCHKKHSTENDSMLIGKFSSSDYVEGKPESFALCYSCHPVESLTNEYTDKFTKFRNGTKNLHFIHVNQAKSRNCIICHDVHGSNNPKLIKDKVKFGNWMMPLKFVKNAEGGSCAPGCHTQLSYNFKLVEKPPTYSITGKITLADDIAKSYLKDLKIHIGNVDSNLSETTIDAESLSFEFKDLLPGIYHIWVDSLQLIAVNLISNPVFLSYEIKNIKDIPETGNMVFEIQKIQSAKKELAENDEIFYDDVTSNKITDEKSLTTEADINKSDSVNSTNNSKNPNHSSQKKKNIIRIKKGESKIFSVKDSKINEIVPEMKSYLYSLVKYLKKFKKNKLLIEVEIEEDVNLAEYNKLSDEYSAKIIEFFTSNGISAARLVTQNINSKLQRSKKTTSDIKYHRINLKIIN